LIDVMLGSPLPLHIEVRGAAIGLVNSSDFLRSLVMIAAVMATSYLPVADASQQAGPGMISCLIWNGANLRKSSTSSLSKPVG